MLLKALPLVNEKKNELRERVNKLESKPYLVIIRVGDDKASEKYVNNKVNLCKEIGVRSDVIHLDANVSNEMVMDVIETANMSDEITGVLLQLPLPKHLDEHTLTEMIAPEKDVDGFTSKNLGMLMQGVRSPRACTPSGIINLLEYYGVDIEGKDVLIINRSNIVGKPLALMMLEKNATVTIAHSKTRKLKEKIKNADIVILGVGIRNFVGAKHFSPNTIIVDVSINFDNNGKLCGDVCKDDYEELLEKGCILTPVPGGVGQMTVLRLIEQTIEMKENHIK